MKLLLTNSEKIVISHTICKINCRINEGLNIKTEELKEYIGK